MSEPTHMDNPPAAGAPKGWRWGYLPCGCRNDGFGNHLHDVRSVIAWKSYRERCAA